MAKRKPLLDDAELPKGIRLLRPGLYQVSSYAGLDRKVGHTKEIRRRIRGDLWDAIEAKQQLDAEVEMRGNGAIEGDPFVAVVFERMIVHKQSLKKSELTLKGYREHIDALLDGVWEFERDPKGHYVLDPEFLGCDCPEAVTVRPVEIRACVECDEPFTSMKDNQAFCSPPHQTKHFFAQSLLPVEDRTHAVARVVGHTNLQTARKACLCRFKQVEVVQGLGRKARLSRLSTPVLQDYLDELGFARDPNTVHRYHATYRLFLNYAKKRKLLRENPAEDVDLPTKPKKRFRRPTDSEVADLVIRGFAENWKLGMLLHLMCVAGPRRGEGIAARWDHLEGDVLTIDVAARQFSHEVTTDNPTKTHSERIVHLDELTVGLLAEHRARMEKIATDAGIELRPDGFIISDSPDGSMPWRPQRVTDAVTRLRERCSYSGRLQDLRGWSHSAAFDAVKDLGEVVGRGGWTDASTFLTWYTSANGSKGAEMANAVAERLANGRSAVEPVAEAVDELAERRRRRVS